MHHQRRHRRHHRRRPQRRRLLQEADLALYRAKDRGRDRADVFDEDLRTRAVGRLGTERLLRRAIDEDRLRVNYQPIVDLATGRTVAAEALVRVWDPKESELIGAETFIEVAEETGLLATIDDWVLRQVIDQAATWRDQFPGSAFRDIAINVTARHLADAGFAQSVINDLAKRDLPADSLQIEVTERVLMEASNSAMSGLKILRAAGVRVGLDDFGTGYSSLSYLRMFPLDVVKIDQSFIAALTRGGTEAAIVASVIDRSHALGMAVVAEGVETASQQQQLLALGCGRAQGYHFAAAGPPEAIEQLVLGSEAASSDAVADEQRDASRVQPHPSRTTGRQRVGRVALLEVGAQPQVGHVADRQHRDAAGDRCVISRHNGGMHVAQLNVGRLRAPSTSGPTAPRRRLSATALSPAPLRPSSAANTTRARHNLVGGCVARTPLTSRQE